MAFIYTCALVLIPNDEYSGSPSTTPNRKTYEYGYVFVLVSGHKDPPGPVRSAESEPARIGRTPKSVRRLLISGQVSQSWG